MNSVLRYAGMVMGFVGASSFLTPIVAQTAVDAGLKGARVSGKVYLIAGLGLVIALAGLVCWSLGELAERRSSAGQ